MEEAQPARQDSLLRKPGSRDGSKSFSQLSESTRIVDYGDHSLLHETPRYLGGLDLQLIGSNLPHA